ncbi:MAG: hypothetical protein JNK93_03405 [Planctomycetia bacterium]|nr:hypothetical protein [Planctomycetia bacterium]
MDPFAGALFAGLGFSLLLMALLPAVLMLVALIYVGLRVRDAKAEHPDPELGLKTAYWLLYTLGVLIFHFGLTILFSHWLEALELTGPARFGGGNFGRPGMGGNDSWSQASRTGWAMVTAGLFLALAFYLVGTLGTRDREWPAVRRLFTGGRIALAGLMVTFAFTFLVAMQFQKDIPPGGIYETALASLAVWLPSMAIHVFLYRWGGTLAYHVPLDERRPRRKPKYTEDDEMPEVAPEPKPSEDAPPRRRKRDDDDGDDGDDEAPRRRRPRDEDS